MRYVYTYIFTVCIYTYVVNKILCAQRTGFLKNENEFTLRPFEM